MGFRDVPADHVGAFLDIFERRCRHLKSAISVPDGAVQRRCAAAIDNGDGEFQLSGPNSLMPICSFLREKPTSYTRSGVAAFDVEGSAIECHQLRQSQTR